MDEPLYRWPSCVHYLKLEILQVRSPSPFQRWTAGKEFGVSYKLHMPFLLFPFKLLNGRFPPLDLFATLGLCQGGKRGRLAQGWKDGQKAILCPVVHPISIGLFYSDCNFHLTQVWKPFLGRGRCKPLCQQQVEVTVLVTEEVGLWLGLWFCSDTWTIHTLLDTHERRKLDFLRLQMYQQGCMAEN